MDCDFDRTLVQRVQHTAVRGKLQTLVSVGGSIQILPLREEESGRGGQVGPRTGRKNVVPAGTVGMQGAKTWFPQER